MKKSLIGMLLVLCLLLCSCSSGGPFTVTFDANGCADPAPLTLEKSGKIPSLKISPVMAMCCWAGTAMKP